MRRLTTRIRMVAAIAVLAGGVAAACGGGAADTDTESAQGESPASLMPTPMRVTIEQPPADPDQPNIVVLMTDDMTVDQIVALPQVQRRIFDAGLTFTQSVVNLPSCCPSRATFLTGQHAANHGVLTNQGTSGGFSSFERQETTLPVSLAAAGYETIFVGKYLNEFGMREHLRYTPPGWTDFRGLIAPTEVLYHSPTLWVNGQVESHDQETHAIEVIHRHALEAIEAAADEDRPIFAFVSYPAPHAQAGGPFSAEGIYAAQRAAANENAENYLRPPVPVPGDEGSFSATAFGQNPAFNEADISDKPPMLQRRQRSGSEITSAKEFWLATLDSLIGVDRSAAEIIDTIEAATPSRDTWLVFTSDNGLLVGEHRQFGAKYLPYEEAVRVPLAIAGPGVVTGRTPYLVSNVDLTPTVADIAGAQTPRPSDGRSLLPILLGHEAPAGRAVLIEGFDFRAKAPPYQAVHTGDSVYIEWLNGDTELYDLIIDPYQLDNLAGHEEARELETRNARLLDELLTCEAQECAGVGGELPTPQHPTRWTPS